MTAPLLQAQVLRAGYGQATVLFDLSLEVEPGEVAMLIGRNGAGKSTTLRCLMGLLPARGGSISLAGLDITRLPAVERSRRGLGYVPEGRRLFGDLTVAENLEVGRQPARDGLPPWTPERLMALFPPLAGMGDRPAARMSGGEQQMLSIARTLMGNPRVLLLDEPAEGLAPMVVLGLAAALRALKASGLAILLADHHPALAETLGDRAYLIERGAVRAELAAAELRSGGSRARLALGGQEPGAEDIR